MKSPTILICASLAVSARAKMQSHDPLQKLLEAKYVAYEKAFSAKDPWFLEKMLAPDYVAEQPGRPPMNRRETIKSFSGLMASSEDVKWPRKIRTLSRHGNRVTVLFDAHFSARVSGPDKKKHALDLLATNEDTWIKVKGDWLLQHSKLLKSLMKVDGKDMPMR